MLGMSEGIPSTISPSAFHLPKGEWNTVVDFLCENFPQINREQWLDRIARGRVLDAEGTAIDSAHRYREGIRIFYFREVIDEIKIPVTESILYADDHLVVIDKPHFLPVIPAGKYVEETLLARLIRRFDNPDLVPLHRIDRHTAGLVLFSANRATRSAHQSLFREQAISKCYEAIAPALPLLNFPLRRATRIATGEPFFRMHEVAGVPNTETLIEVRERSGKFWRYALYPITGKKHQLRVHMAALSAPICNDPLYPQLREQMPDDYQNPLKLLAQRLEFIDPLSGANRVFESRLQLDW